MSGYTTIKYLGVDTFVKPIIIKYDWIRNITEELINNDLFIMTLKKLRKM